MAGPITTALTCTDPDMGEDPLAEAASTDRSCTQFQPTQRAFGNDVPGSGYRYPA